MIKQIIFLILVFIIPALFIKFRIIKYKYRFYAFSLIAIILAYIMVIENWSLRSLGLRFDTFLDYLPYYLFFTVFISLFLVLVSKILLKRKFKVRFWFNNKNAWLFVPIAFVQELVFRGFLLNYLNSFIGSVLFVIFLNALIYTFFNIIFTSKTSELIMIFLEGFFLAFLYMIFPNLILVTLATAIHYYIAYHFNFYKIRTN